MTPKFAKVILPLALRQRLTYSIPDGWADHLELGKRVEVQLGNKRRYAGIVVELVAEHHGLRMPKPLLDILDEEPVIHPWQIELWKWMSQYYACTEGEVMNASLPSGLKLSSESVVILHDDIVIDEWELNDGEKYVVEALFRQHELTIGQIEEMVPFGKSYRVIKGLLDKELILIKERLKESIKAKMVEFVELNPALEAEETFLQVLESLQRAPQQTRLLLALYEMRKRGWVHRKELQKKTGVSSSVLKSVQEKGHLQIVEKHAHEVIRNSEGDQHQLSSDQRKVVDKFMADFPEKKIQVLDGVTGSGKTHVYIELIEQAIQSGGQALFLLPEIALTTQLVERMKNVFGDRCVAYHSRMGDRERKAVWHVVKRGHPVIIGARSALLLPFQELKMIIVDEEHDMSYKQADPAPRYSARDTAIMMSHLYEIPCVLGSATPSLETILNVEKGRFGYAKLERQFHGAQKATIEIVDLRQAYQQGNMVDFFAQRTLEEIQLTVDAGQQVLIFQNRRGHSHIIQCGTCGWAAECRQCDVSMTYHKVFKDIRCHYCGSKEELPRVCPECGNSQLMFKGLGTEKIMEDLQAQLKDVRIARMDLDTARGNKNRSRIIEQMEEHEIDILVGTQMITKGLDFGNIGLVVVPQADQLLFHPDFRTNERAFQLLQQVRGRAGRQKSQGRIIIQSFKPDHRVLEALVNDVRDEFIEQELTERKEHFYPPHFRLIKIEVKHKKAKTADQAAKELVMRLRLHWKNRVIGPSEPSIARIRNLFAKQIWIKYEKRNDIAKSMKKSILEAIDETRKLKGMSNVRFNINVDPQ